ncbi:hypothetical protein VA599_06075 [Chromobacterium sp. TRC.1.1.SA]|uniref:Transcriptional regulator n=1 Tax=Chromobacterium indicum TaxID=3110228 RepID=A0ABV0CGU2_9NEIS
MLELSDELLAQVGWMIGDVLSFEDRGDGTLLVCKVSDEGADQLTIANERLADGTEPVPTSLDEL